MFPSLYRVAWRWRTTPLPCRTGRCSLSLSNTKSSSSERGLPTSLCTSAPIFTVASIRAEPYTCSNSYGAHSWRAHTPSISPGSLSHPTDADGASIYAPLRTGCQTCGFLIARREVFAALQRRCKTFVSRGVVPPHARAQSPVPRLWLFCGRGNWRWVLCAVVCWWMLLVIDPRRCLPPAPLLFSLTPASPSFIIRSIRCSFALVMFYPAQLNLILDFSNFLIDSLTVSYCLVCYLS